MLIRSYSHCAARSARADAATWSTSSSRPSGRRTRAISVTARRSSGMAHNPNAHSTVSNEESGKSSAWASPGRRSASRPRPAARSPAMPSMAGDQSCGLVGAALQRRDIGHHFVEQTERQRLGGLNQPGLKDQIRGPRRSDQ